MPFRNETGYEIFAAISFVAKRLRENPINALS
jgi:hypothetical protein